MHHIFTLEQKPHLRAQIDQLSRESWPEFLLHGEMREWERLFDRFAPFQLLVCDDAEQVLAAGHTVPLRWDGTIRDLPTSIDDILIRAAAAAAAAAGGGVNSLSALAAMVRRPRRGQGLSIVLLEGMKSLARQHGLASLIAPVRPTGKAQYPLIPFEHYVRWTRPDGLPFDSWIRTHHKLGAHPLTAALDALAVAGTVPEWEAWTGMKFPESGDYVVEGALQPVRIDLERGEGRYQDPNYWMHYPL
jgi:hypothetical protein